MIVRSLRSTPEKHCCAEHDHDDEKRIARCRPLLKQLIDALDDVAEGQGQPPRGADQRAVSARPRARQQDCKNAATEERP